MARSLDAAQQQKMVEANQGAKVSSQDVELAVRMAIQMLSEGGGLKVIEDAINKSQDPAMVIGQFLAQMMGKLGEQLVTQLGVDPRIFLAKDGFLEKIIDYIEKKLGYPEEFSDQIYTQVLETVKAAAQNPPAPNDVMGGDPGQAPQGGQPPQQGPVA